MEPRTQGLRSYLHLRHSLSDKRKGTLYARSDREHGDDRADADDDAKQHQDGPEEISPQQS